MMHRRSRLRHLLRASLVSCVCFSATAIAQDNAAIPATAEATGANLQQTQQTQQQQSSNRSASGGNTAVDDQAADNQAINEHAYDESPALGVIVSTCPGNAVCVHGTVWGSPAHDSDIREGDYILSVNDRPVTSPLELQQMIRQTDPEQKTKLVLWRQGEKLAKEVSLATELNELPPGQSAWLGVQLKDDGEGIRLDRVVNGSPAEESGLQEGDVLLTLNGEQIKNVNSFVDRIADLGPGAQLNLTLRRGTQERSVTAQLGTIDEAPIAFLRHAFGEPQWEGQSATTQTPDEVMDSTLDALRREIRELRQQVEKVSGGENAARGKQDEEQRAQPDEAGQGAQLRFDSSTGERTMFVQQTRSNRDERYYDNWNRGSRGWYNNYRRNYRTPYGPIYRSPYYGNSYYNRGGRSYYYGNQNFNRNYGSRYGYGGSGLRLGPNLGIYWY